MGVDRQCGAIYLEVFGRVRLNIVKLQNFELVKEASVASYVVLPGHNEMIVDRKSVVCIITR